MLSVILFFFVFSSSTWSHPLDISISTATFSGKKMNVTTYFHSYEIDYLLQKSLGSKNLYTVDDYFKYSNTIISYVEANAHLVNNSSLCEIKEIQLIPDEAYAILSDGLWVSYSFVCDDEVEKISLNLDYFLEFPLQTNRITLYDFSKWITQSSPIVYKVLTSKIPTLKLDVLNTWNIKQSDSDKDWLSDEDEKIYGTNPNNPDSDGDFFSDSEEIDYGWDPLDSQMWPWQLAREEFDMQVSQENRDKLTEIVNDVSEENLSDFSWNGMEFLKKAMKYINDFFEKNQGNITGVFLFVFLLWVIHTLWPGHSKGLLISYTLEKNNGYLRGFLFAGIFSLTHILDILILYFISRWVSYFFQVNYTFMIQVVSSILLLCVWIYLFTRSFKRVNTSDADTPWSSLWIAFLAWLVPCSFAWSIFLLLHALWKTQWMLVLIAALWLGIFFTLCVIVIWSVFLKQKMYEKIKNIWKYSSLISATMILCISIVMILKIL